MNELSKEERILRVMRTVLVNVAKDTATQPGLKHPLSQDTRDQIRECLELITARQMEFAHAAGIAMSDRPVYPDTPRKSVAVTLDPGASHKPHNGE